MVTLCERKAELAVGAVEREVIRCVQATQFWVYVDHGRLGLVDKRVRQLQDAVGLTGAVSAVELEQKTHESAEVVFAACLERLNDVVQFRLTGGVEGVLKDEPSSEFVDLVAFLLELRRNADEPRQLLQVVVVYCCRDASRSRRAYRTSKSWLTRSNAKGMNELQAARTRIPRKQSCSRHAAVDDCICKETHEADGSKPKGIPKRLFFFSRCREAKQQNNNNKSFAPRSPGVARYLFFSFFSLFILLN